MRYDNPYYDDETVERVLMHAHRFVDEMCTIREVADWSDFSKTTIHTDLTQKLPHIDSELYEEVKILLELNTEERASRGGMGVLKKFKKQGS